MATTKGGGGGGGNGFADFLSLNIILDFKISIPLS